MEEIVEAALPDEKLGQYYTRDSAEDFLLKKISFCEEMKKVCMQTSLLPKH